MHKFLKRPADGGGAAGSEGKAAKLDDGGGGPVPEPRTLMTWNCNGLTGRANSEAQAEALRAMVATHAPDVLALQEVRMPASAPKGAKKGDGQPRSRGTPNSTTPAGRKDVDTVGRLLRTGDLANYRVFYSLSDWKYAGSALLVRRPCAPARVRYSLEEGAGAGKHHPDGRVIIAEFETFDLLATYSPNNGWSEESFARRRQWDAEVTAFLRRQREAGRPVVYVGDLNVAPEDIDLSHPEFFRTREPEGAGRGGPKPPAPQDPDDRGQPGCTTNERLRFSRMLEAGGMLDAYRHQHGDERGDDEAAFAAGPNFTWRGSPGVQVAEHGRYYAKAMRIDHLLVSTELQQRVLSADILGHGPDMQGFLGSDHCPMMLTLSKPPPGT
eukprot:jgi/Tetstr1/431984/TSEL_021461.t1